MITLEEIRKTLDDVIDPCSVASGLPAGLVTMGMIKDVRCEPLSEDHASVQVQLRLTHPGCLMAGPFLVEIKKRLLQLSSVSKVQVNLCYDDDWSTSDMAPEYRERLANHQKNTTTEFPLLRHL